MIRVRYVYSACFIIETQDVSVLCDPWFTEGAYDGSWYHWPVMPWADTLDRLPWCNLVYISHLHPDHWDPTFLKAYQAKHGKQVVVLPGTPGVEIAAKAQ